MSNPLFSVTSYPINTLLTWVQSGKIAIPEIQRPFVWSKVQVRNLIDSLYKGYPVGYLITWLNPAIKLKDGSFSSGKPILIDGQQRVTALMAALLGREVLTKDYRRDRIRIAFNPDKERFEVHNPAIAKDPAWIDDIAKIFHRDFFVFQFMDEFAKLNPNSNHKDIGEALLRVSKIIFNQVGIIELADNLDIETVTEIFIRVNSAGTPLSQADFVMSKIAVNESYGGNTLRKAIDYFCHLAVAPEFFTTIVKRDPDFTKSPFWQKMTWLKNVNDDLYDPTYTDMLRVAFTSKFERGRLQDLVALLSGRNFETLEYEARIAKKAFALLEAGIYDFMKKTNFDRLTLILRSSGFVTSRMIRNRSAVNFAFILYLRGLAEKVHYTKLKPLVRRWYAMSVLTQRYSGSAEAMFDRDIRQIVTQGLQPYVESVIDTELPHSYWTGLLPQRMETSFSTSPYFIAYQAAQEYLGDKGFLSTDIKVRDLLRNSGHRHHIFPRNYLRNKGLKRGRYNQIANYAITQSEINIAISNTPPKTYFPQLAEQVNGGPQKYGGIVDRAEMEKNFAQNCVPLSLLDGEIPDYDDFLAERRKLMAQRIKTWFEAL